MIVVVLAAFIIVLIAAAFIVNRPPKSSAEAESDIHRRLAAEKAQLESLEAERVRLGDPAYDRATEDEIIRNELVELELQDIDEQLTRIRNSAGNES